MLSHQVIQRPVAVGGLAVRPGGVGPGADGLEIQGAAGLSPFARALRGGLIREDTAAGDPLLAEPAHSPRQEATRGGLLRVSQHAPPGRPGGWRHWLFRGLPVSRICERLSALRPACRWPAAVPLAAAAPLVRCNIAFWIQPLA